MASHNIVTALSEAGIPLITPHDADFTSTLQSYTGTHEDAKPTVVTLPNTPEQVATIVTRCIEADSPMVVRGGGHDMYGRFTAPGVVSVDLRKLNSVTVSGDKSTVRVGGGVTASRVLEELEKHGLQVPVGSCGSVGFTAWCLGGGLGPYLQSYGLGADQIVGAKVVNAQGKLVDADERLLEGLRGGGGSLAVVVELVVKAYPLENIQAGLIIFDSSDLEKAITTFFTNYEAMMASHQGTVPSKLSLMPFVFPLPGLGVSMILCYVWNGSADEDSLIWLDRAASLAPLTPGVPAPRDAIKQMTPFAYLTMLTSFLPTEVAGRSHTASVTKFSPDVIAAIAKQCLKMPPGGTSGFNIHIMRSDSPAFSGDVPASVCPYREPHMSLEILGLASDKSGAADAAAWSLETRNAFVGLDDSVKRTYLPLTAPEFVNLHDVFGDKLEVLRQIKKEYDPKGVFRNTVPRLVD